MNRRDYRKVARKYGVSVQEAKEEMQKAIDSAWDNPNKTAENIFMNNQIKPDGSKPTIEEIICFSAKQIKNKY